MSCSIRGDQGGCICWYREVVDVGLFGGGDGMEER